MNAAILCGCAGLLAIASVPPAAGQPSAPTEARPLVTDRPDFTESAISVDRPQLESGYTFSRVGDEEHHAIGELLLRLPVARRVELRVGLNSFALVETPDGVDRGFEDASAGVKIALMEPGGGSGGLVPALAVLAGTTLPTGADGLGERVLQPEARLALAWGLCERVGLSSNLGYARIRMDGGSADELSASLALGVGVSERLGSYVEAFGFSQRGADVTNSEFLNGGLTFLLSDDVQLDARAGVGMNSLSPDYFVGLGFSTRW